MFQRDLVTSKDLQSDIDCGCAIGFKCYKNYSTQFPEEKGKRRPLSSIDFVSIPHRTVKGRETFDKATQFPENLSINHKGLSEQGRRSNPIIREIEEIYKSSDSEGDKQFKEVIKRFAKYPLKSEYKPARSYTRWPH